MTRDYIFSEGPATRKELDKQSSQPASNPDHQLSNPFSTGSGGPNFENNVQSAFVVLMLSGGLAPCLPPWPVKKIKLQGRYAGFNTDDFIAFAEERNGGRAAKLLAQIKHSLSITEKDEVFAKVIKAAWLDFQNPEIFDAKYDEIALITGPLSSHDVENARRVLEWARTSANAQEFLEKVNLSKFSSEAKREKLQAFRSQLKKANNGVDLEDEILWQFMKCFHILGYDLDVQSGVTLSLVNSHIAQFTPENIPGIWGMIAKEIESFNQSAGTITIDTLSEDIRNAFSKQVPVQTIPTEFLKPQKESATQAPPDHFKGEQADALAFAALLGSWNEKVEADKSVIRELIEGHD